MPSMGPMEIIIILAIALIVLGPKRLPDAGRSIGKGMREFKDALTPGDPPATATATTPAQSDAARHPRG